MTFTLENTKDATHIKSFENLPGFEFYKGVMGGNYSFMSESSDFNWKGCFGAVSNTIELSRPHNETREHWTTNGVTQYAQPQGNEMDIKTLIPLDFSVDITPAVDGDLIWDDIKKESYELCDFDTSVVNETWRKGFPNLFVVSFADRPSTGARPDDDVLIEYTVNTGAKTDTIFAGTVHWPMVETWKPNHAAMLKQWQAEQNKATGTLGGPGGNGAKEWPSCDSQENIGPGAEIRIGSPVEPYEWTEKHDEQLKAAVIKVKELDKPTFTQAMKDDRLLPPVGSQCELQHDHPKGSTMFPAGTKVYIGGHANFGIDGQDASDVAVFIKVGTHDTGTGSASRFKPIQTAEDKLRDAMRNILIDSYGENLSTVTMDTINLDIDKLLASDKFTITLKGE